VKGNEFCACGKRMAWFHQMHKRFRWQHIPNIMCGYVLYTLHTLTIILCLFILSYILLQLCFSCLSIVISGTCNCAYLSLSGICDTYQKHAGHICVHCWLVMLTCEPCTVVTHCSRRMLW
jgi:hypothetical protein